MDPFPQRTIRRKQDVYRAGDRKQDKEVCSGRRPSVDNKISVVRFVMKLPFFQRLPEYEKENILQKNVSVGVLFQKCTFFNPSKSILFEIWSLHFLHRLQLGYPARSFAWPERGREAEKKAESLWNQSWDGREYLQIQWPFCFSSWYRHGEVRVCSFEKSLEKSFACLTIYGEFIRFVRIQSQISYWPRDCHEYILLLLIILFEPSHIAETGTVDRIQTYFSQLLFKYLLTISEGERRWKAVGRFGSGIDCISKCAELHDLFTKRMFPLTDDIKLLFDEMPFYYWNIYFIISTSSVPPSAPHQSPVCSCLSWSWPWSSPPSVPPGVDREPFQVRWEGVVTYSCDWPRWDESEDWPGSPSSYKRTPPRPASARRCRRWRCRSPG